MAHGRSGHEEPRALVHLTVHAQLRPARRIELDEGLRIHLERQRDGAHRLVLCAHILRVGTRPRRRDGRCRCLLAFLLVVILWLRVLREPLLEGVACRLHLVRLEVLAVAVVVLHVPQRVLVTAGRQPA